MMTSVAPMISVRPDANAPGETFWMYTQKK